MILNWKKIIFSVCTVALAPIIYFFLNDVLPGIPIQKEFIAKIMGFFICLIFGISTGVSAVTEYRIKNKR